MPLNQETLTILADNIVGEHVIPERTKFQFTFYDVPVMAKKYHKTSSLNFAVIIFDVNHVIKNDDILKSKKIKVSEIISSEELLMLTGDNTFDVLTGKYTFKNNLLHSYNDKPAIIKDNGDIYYYTNGVIDRKPSLNETCWALCYYPSYAYTNHNLVYLYVSDSKDEIYEMNEKIRKLNYGFDTFLAPFTHRERPAVISKKAVAWVIDGEYHRTGNLPAVITPTSMLYYLNGELDRDSEPAIVDNNGDRYYYNNGRLHRIGGPAIEYADGSSEWYVNGEEISPPQILNVVRDLDTRSTTEIGHDGSINENQI